MTTQRNTKKYEELLESDDEFPDAFIEPPDIPAYLNDNRFDIIKFDWIYNKNIGDKNLNVPDMVPNNNTKNVFLHNKCNVGLKKGLLNKLDVYCLKSLENKIADNTLLWFVNFLMCKDMQSQYKFLRSCLVNEDVYTFNQCKKEKDNNIDLNKKCNYRINVK
ncbi:unnamed protein product [Parnassius apollo]|uniref:(apollo) hypothetical protein n=1 Tax=Parnassius apollo TaxID=110799 RepID=A0A8S3WRZ7_PARAO|nr:unnamed protein product [Parnassius apollo]